MYESDEEDEFVSAANTFSGCLVVVSCLCLVQYTTLGFQKAYHTYYNTLISLLRKNASGYLSDHTSGVDNDTGN